MQSLARGKPLLGCFLGQRPDPGFACWSVCKEGMGPPRDQALGEELWHAGRLQSAFVTLRALLHTEIMKRQRGSFGPFGGSWQASERGNCRG